MEFADVHPFDDGPPTPAVSNAHITSAEQLRENLKAKKERIESLRRSVVMAVGGLRAEMEQKAVLETTVGVAKGRLLLKPKVDAFLEELLEEAHARRIGYMEKLLTALVDHVMPGESPIKLELQMKSGAPWLDILSEIAEGDTEDVYEDQGGALTNVIILGLRMVAIAKSRARRIIFLDESDCWIENSRVPAFYNVMRDAAKKIGFQCFAISHHDIREFQGTKEAKIAGDGIRVARIYGHPKAEGGVHVDNDKVQHKWADDEPGLRFIRLRNIQGYIDETILLSPGVNGFVGPNNHGKSTVVRAVRAVFFGEIRPKLVSKGKETGQIEFGFEKNLILRFTRNNKKGPANTWELIGPNGAVVEDDSMKYSTSKGSGVPDWVQHMFGIGKIDGLDPQIIKQKEPIFLLDKGGHVRASVLSIGQETGHIQTMIQMHKKRCSDDNAVIKDGEDQMGRLLGRVKKLEAVAAMEPQVAECEDILLEALQAVEQSELLEQIEARLTTLRASLETCQRKLQLFDRLPASEDIEIVRQNLAHSAQLVAIHERIETGSSFRAAAIKKRKILERLPEEMPSLIDNQEATRIGKALVAARTAQARLADRIAILKRLPDAVPEIKDMRAAEAAAEKIKQTTALLRKSEAEREANALALAECEHELHGLMEAMGHSCPLCGQQVDDPRRFVGYQAEEVIA